MWRRALALTILCLYAQPAFSQAYGVAVQVSTGKPVPTQGQLETILRPGDYVRDVLGWQKADPHCNLGSPDSHGIVIPAAMATLYQRVAAAQGRNFVTLAFNNKACGQVKNSGAKAFPDTPALRAEFAAYAAAVVRQVPALGGVSIWNEMDGTWNGGLVGESARLTAYCLLANAVIAEVRKDDQTVPIAIGATVGWNVDSWITGMFDQYGCTGKGDSSIWLDVHPYLSGEIVRGTNETDWQLWRAAISKIRSDGITNPLVATEWGAKSAYLWSNKHPNGDYLGTFKSEILAQDQNWAGAMWYELLYDRRSPNAGLYDHAGNLTQFGSRYIADFRN